MTKDSPIAEDTGTGRSKGWRQRVRDVAARLAPFPLHAGVIALVLGAGSIPSLFRALHMLENGYAVRLPDWRGVATDFGSGVAVGLLLLSALKASRALFVIAATLWVAVNAGYYEFLRVFGSPFALSQAQFLGDPQFLEGSGLGLNHPWLVLALLAGVLAFSMIGRSPVQGVRPPQTLALAIVVSLLPHLIPPSTQLSEWRHTDLVSANLVDAARRLFGGTASASNINAVMATPEELRADLSGTRWLDASGKPNVLVVFIESVSAGHIPSIAATAGVNSTVKLPRLSALASDAIVFTRFVVQQNQSNRGVYASLCGDLPELARVIPKMSRIASGRPRPCLPAFLGAAGYQSVFINATNSNFMQMRDFGLKVGFDRAYGEEGASPDLPRGPWGLFDDGLYATALDEIGKMEGDGKPWFMTLFTSSTHHPFQVRPGAVVEGADDRARAWDFADRSVAEFVEQLRQRGILDDTLVIITSDEAGYVNDPGGRAEEYLGPITQNWGYVIAFAPTAGPASIPDYYAQSDLALSVLDYLGLAGSDSGFLGRSMFRRYSTSRELLFGSVYHRRVHSFDTGSGDLTLCDEQLLRCRLYRDQNHDLFSPNMRLVADLVAVPSKLRDYQAYSLTLPRPANLQNLRPSPLPPS